MPSDLRQSEGWSRYLATQGWEIAKLPITNYFRPKGENAIKSRDKLPIYVFIRKLPLIGSAIKIQRPPVIPSVEKIDKLAKKHRALFVKLEPLSAISNQLSTMEGFKPDPSPSLPTKTIVIDLTKSEEELWRNLSQDARQSIRKAESNQLSVISYQDGDKKPAEALKDFHHLLRRTGQRQNFWTPSFAQLKAKVGFFGENALLSLAFPTKPRQRRVRLWRKPNNQTTKQPVAGALILIHEGVGYGHLAASSEMGRKLYASYLLMWEMIRFLKNPKPRALTPIRYFDLEGIYDPRYHKLTKSWQGLTLFKRKFGGKEVEYPQPLIKYYHPLAKLLFKLSAL